MNDLLASHSLPAFSASVSKTGWRSNVDRPITLRSSLVAACCSRASFNSLPRLETDERFDRPAVGAMCRLVLAALRPVAELALRVLAELVLPPVLDGRAIYAPLGQQGHLIGPNLHSGRG